MISPAASTNSDESHPLIIDEGPMEIESDENELVNFRGTEVSEDKENNFSSAGEPLTNKDVEREIPVAVVAPSPVNKEKSANAKPKRQAHGHCFKLNTLEDAEVARLCISARPSQFYNMRLYMLPGTMLACDFLRQIDSPPELSSISLSQLLNWPEVRVTINFRDFTLSRTIRANYEYELVFGNNNRVNLDTSANVMETQIMSAIVTSKTHPKVSTSILLTYFSALIDAAVIAEMSRARQTEIKHIYEKFQKDFEELNVVDTKKDHSHFVSAYKYMRIFDNDTKYVESKRHAPKVVMRETINPEVLFSVDKCKFDIDRIDSWENDLMAYLDSMLIKQDMASLNGLKEMLKKCITLSCTICSQDFEGLLCMISLKSHLMQHHNNTKWSCVHCEKSFSPFELTDTYNWFHKC